MFYYKIIVPAIMICLAIIRLVSLKLFYELSRRYRCMSFCFLIFISLLLLLLFLLFSIVFPTLNGICRSSHGPPAFLVCRVSNSLSNLCEVFSFHTSPFHPSWHFLLDLYPYNKTLSYYCFRIV